MIQLNKYQYLIVDTIETSMMPGHSEEENIITHVDTLSMKMKRISFDEFKEMYNKGVISGKQQRIDAWVFIKETEEYEKQRDELYDNHQCYGRSNI